LRRLVVLSILLILGGLVLLLPSSALYSLITKGTTSSGSTTAIRFGIGAAAAPTTTTSNTTTIESLVGFGLVGLGAVVELLSLVADVGAVVPSRTTTTAESEMGPPPNPRGPATSAASAGEDKP
jgi:hypothetical protein